MNSNYYFKMLNFKQTRSKACLFMLLILVFLVAFCVGGQLFAQDANAATYKVYFHRDFSKPKNVVATKTVQNLSTLVKNLYKPNNANGTLAKYATYKDCHYLYYANSAGNYKYFVYTKAQSKYPLGTMSVKNCRSQGYSVKKIMSLAGVSGKNLHLYLAYKSKSHSFKVQKQATCVNAGSESCSVCAYKRSIAATGKHNFKVQKPATCASSGIEACSMCTNMRIIPATGEHNYKFVCLGDGKHQSKCSVCNFVEDVGFCAPNSKGKCIFCGGKLSSGANIVTDGSKYIATSASTLSYCGPLSTSVTSIVIPSQIEYNGVCYKVTKLAQSCCTNLKKLKKVVLGSNIKSIGAKAFSACKKLKSFKASSSVLTKIGDSAFKKCKKLKTVVILSKKLTSLGKNSFKGCKSLKHFTYKSPSLSKSKLRKAGVLR